LGGRFGGKDDLAGLGCRFQYFLLSFHLKIEDAV